MFTAAAGCRGERGGGESDRKRIPPWPILCKTYPSLSQFLSLGGQFLDPDVLSVHLPPRKFKLFQALDREIDSLRKSRKKGFVRVARAGGRKPPQDLSKADDIVDWLDQRGIVDQQYEILKDMIESARNLEVAAKRGGDDGDD
jgi:hypothetical protein